MTMMRVMTGVFILLRCHAVVSVFIMVMVVMCSMIHGRHIMATVSVMVCVTIFSIVSVAVSMTVPHISHGQYGARPGFRLGNRCSRFFPIA